MNMSETPEKKKARLRYDNVFMTAWTDEFHFIKHSRKGNKFAFCEFCRTATECTILRPSEKKDPLLPLLVSRGLTCMIYYNV